MTACPRADCHGILTPALRYTVSAAPLPVSICWTCGWETDPLACCRREQTGSLQRVCAQCDAEVVRPSSKLIRGRQVFCSVACYAAHKRKGVVTRICPCSATFDVPVYRLQRNNGQEGGRYCSPACQRAYRTRGKGVA